MSDNDLIRRGDALAVVRPAGERPCDCRGCRGSLPTAEDWARWDAFSRAAAAIEALPAVTVGEDVAKAAIDRAIERLRALPNHAGRPAWDAIVAEEIRAALEPVAAPVMAPLSDAEIASIMAEGPKGPPMRMPDPAAIREAALREAIEAYPRGVGAILALIQQGAVKEDLE